MFEVEVNMMYATYVVVGATLMKAVKFWQIPIDNSLCHS